MENLLLLENFAKHKHNLRKLVDLFTRQKKNMENLLLLENFAKHKHNFVSMKLLLKYCCGQMACLKF